MASSINTGAFSSSNITGVTEDLLNSAVGGLSPLNNFARHMTGSRAIIKVNDKLFGFAFAITFNIKTSVIEVNTIDDWTPYELVPNRIQVDGTLSMFHIPGHGPSYELVQPNALSFLFHKYITIDISDQTTGQQIFKTNKAMITSRTQSLQAGELSTITLNWRAIGFIDEITPAYPNGFDGVDNGSNPAGGALAAINNL